MAFLERQGNWANLGRLALLERPELGWPDRTAARAAFRKAVECAELFREQFRDERERRRVQVKNLEVYERLIEVCVDLWETARADGAGRGSRDGREEPDPAADGAFGP